MLKVGIVGIGGMGNVHANKYPMINNVELIGAYDVDTERLNKFCQDRNIKAFHSLDDLFNAVDAVDICTPTIYHAEIVEKSAKAKKHIFLEKPVARTWNECERIIKDVRDNKIICMVGNVVRYFKEFQNIANLVKSNAVGTPAVVRTRRGGGFPGRWFGDYEKSGGVILDLTIHDIDWIRTVFGPVKRVFAQSLSSKGYTEGDYSLITMKLESGALAHIEGSWKDPSGFRVAVEVAGDKGLIDFDSRRDSSIKTATEQNIMPGGIRYENPLNLTEDPYFNELTDFINAVITGEDPPITIDDACESVKIALAAMKSAETGQAVELIKGASL